MRPRYSSTRKVESERVELTTSKGTNMDEIKTLDIDMVSSNDMSKDLSEIIQSSQQAVFRMFDDLMKTDSDSPTMGIILCADTNSDIAKYSVMADSNQLFTSKYKLYLPNEDELKAEIEYQKELYYLNYDK